MKHLSITSALFVFLQIASFGQMLKFPIQKADLTNNASFLISNQNNYLFFWFNRSQLLQSKSTDGLSWSDPVILKDNVPEPTNGYPREITAKVMTSGRMFLVFRDSYFYSMFSYNNGQTWSVPKPIPAGSLGLGSLAHSGSIAQSGAYNIVFFYSRFYNGINSLCYIISGDNGSSWSNETISANGPVNGTISPVTHNTVKEKLILVYQNQGLFRLFSTDGGYTWESSGTMISNDKTINAPKVVRDQSGKLWLFYQKNVSTPFRDIAQPDIFYITSNDSGLTWSSENQFTKYKGFDGFYNVSANEGNPMVSFSTDRMDSLNTIYNLEYGAAGLTDDIQTPPCVYKYVVSNSAPQPGEPFKIDLYVDYESVAPTILLRRIIGGIPQPSLTMYDDGTNSDSIANDKIYSCEVPGLVAGDALQADFIITNNVTGSFIYKGPIIVIPLPNSSDSTLVNVNRFKMPINNSGVLADILINGENMAGGMYDGNITLFSGGFYMSGISNGIAWSNGAFSDDYFQDYVPGRVGIIPEDPRNYLYIVKSTDPPFSTSWQNWKTAVSQGADFYDGNHDGIYNPVDLNGNGVWDSNEDRPDLLGDMTAWCVYNDGRPSVQRRYTDVIPQGIEIQQTVFAQKDSADLNNVVFVRYRLINRGTVAEVLDSVYFGSVNDVDIGDSGMNDLSGCDTISQSVYTYHKLGSGDNKWGTNPPAETITLLQGPISYIPGITFTDVNSNGKYDPGTDTPIDTGYSFSGPLIGKSIYPGAKNLNMTSANDYFKAWTPQNVIQTQYTLKGRQFELGSFYDPCTFSVGQVLGGINCTTVNPLFLFSGDPLTQTGWINISPRDQRNILNTGPFKLEKNKPVDIIIANIVGRGSDPLNSITVAKQYAANTISYCYSNFPNSILTGIKDLPQVINNFNLYQNYPNPFNPTTRIKYSVGTTGIVSIKVFDILGREVALLLNELKNPGNYELNFNAGKYNLASGVYFYKLISGGFTSVKKMLLLK